MGWKTIRRARRRLPGQEEKVERKRKDLSELLDGVWGLNINSNLFHPTGYLQHYRELHYVLDSSFISFPDREAVVRLLDSVKLNRDLPLQQIKEDLKATGRKCIVSRDSDKAAAKAIEFAVQLWLMVRPEPDMYLNNKLRLKDVVARSFSTPKTSPWATISPQYERLLPDFGGKNLVRIGGIEIIWTSFLSEHLQFVSRHQLKVFVHRSILREYAEMSER
jgi:hypothetical protein